MKTLNYNNWNAWYPTSEACPKCGQALVSNGKTVACPAGHYTEKTRKNKKREGK